MKTKDEMKALQAKTTYGRIGVKVWIYKGQVLERGKKLANTDEGFNPPRSDRPDRRDRRDRGDRRNGDNRRRNDRGERAERSERTERVEGEK